MSCETESSTCSGRSSLKSVGVTGNLFVSYMLRVTTHSTYDSQDGSILVNSLDCVPESMKKPKYKHVAELIRNKITLTGFKHEEHWNHEKYMALIEEEFLPAEKHQILVAFMQPKFGFTLMAGYPNRTVSEVCYFSKHPETDGNITMENFNNFVQFGTVIGAGIESLLRVMNGIYAPYYSSSSAWPVSIKNDFTIQLHRFMSSLTDARWKMEGKTVMYIPMEGLKLSPNIAAKDKELVSRLEAIMIHWTRQIKEVLGFQGSHDDGEESGPLQEIDFWKNRCEDLSNLSKQLDKPSIKHITKILELAKSSYVLPFLKLTSEIKNNNQKAQSNLKFLNSLKELCYELAECKPRDIVRLLPTLVNRVRMIWINSDHYNSPDLITGMFRKISNEIIRRCCEVIDLGKLFTGFVASSIECLKDCIFCCESYKDVYNKLSKVHRKFSHRPWFIDKNGVFAQIDAFVQRCKELIEICECQAHFGRYIEGEQEPMPIFQGIRGQEIVTILTQIQVALAKHIQPLRGKIKTVLNVKVTSWHDDYNKFRLSMKDLEVMMQNALNASFSTVTTVDQGVEILDVFAHLQVRETIRRTIEKKTMEIYDKFYHEMGHVKRELAERSPIGLPSPSQPYYASNAHWAKLFSRRIRNMMMALDQAHFVPQVPVAAETRNHFQQLLSALEEVTQKSHNDFKTSQEADLIKMLDIPLMAHHPTPPYILLNFRGPLLKAYQELLYWEKYNLETPLFLSPIIATREPMRILREKVMLIIRDYNRVMMTLKPDDRLLFKERIKVLEKRILPGLTKIFWSSKMGVEPFIMDCRMHAADLQCKVDNFKSANKLILCKCRHIAQNLLVKIDGDRIYENLEFSEYQAEHRQMVALNLEYFHKEIINTMNELRLTFLSDSLEIQREWANHIDTMDNKCENAFRLNVKYSLREVNKAINGDGRTDPSPLFKLALNLDGDKLIFVPTLSQLTGMVTSLLSQLTSSISNIPRLTDKVQRTDADSAYMYSNKYDTANKEPKLPIYEAIAKDEDINKIHQTITKGMQEISVAIREPLGYWGQFKEIWEVSKQEFMAQYKELKPHVSSMDADISRYGEVSNKVIDADAIVTTKFLQLDFSMLKASLVRHCKDWQNRLFELLLETASDNLYSLYNYIKEMGEMVSVIPENLDQLSASMALIDKLNDEIPILQAKFPGLDEQFGILDKYEVFIPESVEYRKKMLESDWQIFQKLLQEAEQMIKKSKEKFKAGLLTDTDEMKKLIQALIQRFHQEGPFASSIPTEVALEINSGFKVDLEKVKLKEQEIRKGLNLFKIEQPPSREINTLEKEIENITLVWKINQEWEKQWDIWKCGKFNKLNTLEMDHVANTIFKKMVKNSKDFKDKKWEIVDFSKSRVDQFKKTMPLIQNMRNPAMKTRHWNQIKAAMMKKFDENGDDFTLEKIIDLGFDQYAVLINEISNSATKELAIENAIKNIESVWQSQELDLIPYKDKGHLKIKGTDDIFNTLEDHQVQLATMKSSRFAKPFEHIVDRWERDLSQILETLEALLNVQRLFLYLENIFQGGDIRKQLPKETHNFDKINVAWRKIMIAINKNKIVRQSMMKTGLNARLGEMSERLEDIMKSLDFYLETKRNVFPRFYFISNDDLLEILGQGRNPELVQPHLKKCFDNIHLLKLEKQTKPKKPITRLPPEASGMKGRKSVRPDFLTDDLNATAGATPKKKPTVGDQLMDALGMCSGDGEEIAFKAPLQLNGPVEAWLALVEKTMRTNLQKLLRDCILALKKAATKREKWIKDWAGQLCITSSQIQWTADISKALIQVAARHEKKPLKNARKKQIFMLNKFSELIRTNLTKLQRLKINALVVIEVHQRDITEKLSKTNSVQDSYAFEWLSQLRFYWDKDIDDCAIRQTNTYFRYGYEYLGNSGRLVITPLTDRCYITLTTALHLHRGGSPKGPAGTGKTETTKDLGKALGAYVIVVNCSDGLDYKSMGRMFSGLSQTGAWGCFDEFNRINIEVLSVVAQQILSIFSALMQKVEQFLFEGAMIKLIPTVGIFITMNPGYAGRTELPDNLKSMFRPIAMVTPDSGMIAEITLFAEGFTGTKVLAKKVFTLYSLSVQQLSKQDHYDFGLRALVSVLRFAGKKKRANPDLNDEEVLLVSMNDMNLAKLSSVDLPLFKGIVSDLFPGVEPQPCDYSMIREAITGCCQQMNLQPTEFTLIKVIQLFETKNSRHSTMIVGHTLSGKTVTWKLLKQTYINLNRCNPVNFPKVAEFALNPKSISLGELYGEFNLSTNEWRDGVLSSVMRTTCGDDTPDEKWILFDGPVDTLWIESMNSVMDDNKILTLINGERISMPDQVSLLFEVENLAQASPATVSRCGMVYNDVNDLGWEPFYESWLNTKTDKFLVEELKKLSEKYISKVLEFILHHCKHLIPISELNGVISFTKLFDILATAENGVDTSDTDNCGRVIEIYYQFCMTWSICASVDEDGRKKFDAFLKESETGFPNKDTIYEYFIDHKTKDWTHWDIKLKDGWKYNSSIPFYKIIVPTVDTVRYSYLVQNLVENYHPALLVGPVGTGKTSVATNITNKLDVAVWTVLTVNMSAQTSSSNVQDIIESRVEKRTKGTYVPIGNKKLLTFLDDLNMPAKDLFGSQPPLELIRLWLDYGFWYDRVKVATKFITGMYLFAAMGPPGGGRMQISKRLLSRFNLINMTFPGEINLKRIFGSMLSQKLTDFEEELKSLADTITTATLEMYHVVINRFLPTPTKIHYLFNLRDISRIFQGLLRVNKLVHDSRNTVIRLWIHECFRVFADRMINDSDYQMFIEVLSDKLADYFDQTFHNICPNKDPPIFGDYMNKEGVYEDITDRAKLKVYMNDVLNEYNGTAGVVPMNLVLFNDAIQHISKLIRVVRQPRGNMLLIGIGGSGRQSIAKLSSYICNYITFQIEITKHYRKTEFREDLKRLYMQAGVENKPTVFLFNDTQIAEESFLEDINNILGSGEVSNLYKPEEFEEIRSTLADIAKYEGIEDTPQNIFNYLIDRVKGNMHVVLCMSPVGDMFRNRIRMYPALVNCTTIDWFSDWPMDALQEVAERYIADLTIYFGEIEVKRNDRMKVAVASIFSIVHSSVAKTANKMFLELKRHNYVTPTNYLELVSGYIELMESKRTELSDNANKLKNGLGKIDDTREKVEVMSAELEIAREKVAAFQKECDDYLVIIVEQKREADEQAKSVSITREKIKGDEAKCLHMAELAQNDLAQAMPALEAAVQALEALNKKDITEIKSYGKPPRLVEKVMEAVMILRGGEPTWAEAKKHLSEQDFIKQLINFDKENISDRTLKKIGQYCAGDDFQPEVVGKVSLAAKSLCMWVRAMEVYGRIYRIVEPKRQRLLQAEATLREKQEALAAAQRKLDEVNARMKRLQEEYNEKMEQKLELQRQAEHTEKLLDRANKLMSGLAGEKVRWEVTVADLEGQIDLLPGDCMVASGFLSYMGPFLSEYRDEMMKIWSAEIRKKAVPYTNGFSFVEFMVNPTLVRDWNIQGLPRDDFSVENGVITTRGNRWPLMIDPQGQALKWVKSMEDNLKVIDFQMKDYMKILETSIQAGKPVLLQNVQDKLDPGLDPILNKAFVKVPGGKGWTLKLGDKDLEYNMNFKFYIATKLPNPHYSPEICSKTCLVNFAIKEQGLEAQLLGIVVRKERPELEQQKDKLVMSIAGGKRKIKDLEDEILRLLNEAQGSLLDDETLLNTLQSSKVTSAELTEQLVVAEKTEIQIDTAREGYRSCATRASILFFVLNDLVRIDPMYQFALTAYIDLFNISIDKSQRSPRLEERIVHLNDYHTYAVYRNTCRGLFEKHKLLFSLQMCVKILQNCGKMDVDEYNFFLRGGVVLDRENQYDNPCSSWLSEVIWDHITELDKLVSFRGIVDSFEQYSKDWCQWYTSAEPEVSELPAEYETLSNEFHRMIIVRCLRPDRLTYCATTFIVNNIGPKFVEPPVLDMRQVVDDSTTRTPLIFVLSPGVDPTNSLIQLADNCGMNAKFHALSLGQGQAPIATKMIADGLLNGDWVFLANCHLSLSWMPVLDKLVENLQTQEVHSDFRLFLSSSPNPDFPISILQSGLKMTTEPPKGLRSNMKRLYQLVKTDTFNGSKKPQKYKKLLFCLCFFHSVLLERRKFRMLGWNIMYEFNDSDFIVSDSLLMSYLDMYDDTPWDALKYLISDINYGGHVTDDLDRRLLNTYISDYFREEVLNEPFYKLSILHYYYIPKDCSLNGYKDFVAQLPAIDNPEAFGQNLNAEIASQIEEAQNLLTTLLSLQPQVSTGTGISREDYVLDLAGNIFKQIPDNIDYETTAKLINVTPSPLNVVLLQEIQRYNALLNIMRHQLSDLDKGVKGLVVMSTDLEDIFFAIYEGKVPPQWARAYPSSKPLASWTRDLLSRMEMFTQWSVTARTPKIFTLGFFTFPTGFLTAVLQSSARLNSISIDSLSWEFSVMTVDDNNISHAPKDGVYIKGLYLQGAGWDRKHSYLVEAAPMQLLGQIPTIHFKPVENKKKSQKNMYVCPCYYYANRTGTSDRASYIVSVDLKTVEKPPEHWTRRATALLANVEL